MVKRHTTKEKRKTPQLHFLPQMSVDGRSHLSPLVNVASFLAPTSQPDQACARWRGLWGAAGSPPSFFPNLSLLLTQNTPCSLCLPHWSDRRSMLLEANLWVWFGEMKRARNSQKCSEQEMNTGRFWNQSVMQESPPLIISLHHLIILSFTWSVYYYPCSLSSSFSHPWAHCVERSWWHHSELLFACLLPILAHTDPVLAHQDLSLSSWNHHDVRMKWSQKNWTLLLHPLSPYRNHTCALEFVCLLTGHFCFLNHILQQVSNMCLQFCFTFALK